MNHDHSIHPAARGLLAAALLLLTGALGLALWTMPQDAVGLWSEVSSRLDAAGATNPVTAVLLNFRGYDTLLEIAVLTIALLAIWSLREAPDRGKPRPSGQVLGRTVATLVPLMMLIAGYLLWAGSSRPGGAFPAAAIAASGAVLVLLANIEVARVAKWWLRMGVVVGLVTFIAVGAVNIVSGAHFLEYPVNWAAAIVVLIESASTVSIALILASIFAGRSTRLSRAYRQWGP